MIKHMIEQLCGDYTQTWRNHLAGGPKPSLIMKVSYYVRKSVETLIVTFLFLICIVLVFPVAIYKWAVAQLYRMGWL